MLRSFRGNIFRAGEQTLWENFLHNFHFENIIKASNIRENFKIIYTWCVEVILELQSKFLGMRQEKSRKIPDKLPQFDCGSFFKEVWEAKWCAVEVIMGEVLQYCNFI